MTLYFAQRCAARLLERLAPYCERIEVAGSIRRHRPEVGDIDLVAIPKLETRKDLFGKELSSRNLLADHLRQSCESERWVIEKDGGDYLVFMAGKIQVDIWYAPPHRWGTLMLCRTGSKEHNIWLCNRAIDRRGKWNPHHGLYLDSRTPVSATEEEIYTALALPFLDPVRDRDEPTFRRIPPLVPSVPSVPLVP